MVDQNLLFFRKIPFFRHLIDSEIIQLLESAKPLLLKKNSTIKCDSHSLYIVRHGIATVPNSLHSVYITPGSFFGELPFCERGQETVEVLSDSLVYELSDVDMYQVFCNSIKALRGYLTIAHLLGLNLTDKGQQLFNNKTHVITVFGTGKHCGKTTLALAIAAECSRMKKTILLDASYDGISIFDMCGKKLLPPISQKLFDDTSGKKFISQRIEKVSEMLDILNLAYGSKVQIDPQIVKPLMFYLSLEYSYIIIDCSNDDVLLRNEILFNTDVLVSLVNEKSLNILHDIVDATLTQGQQCIKVINRHFESNATIDGTYYEFNTIPFESHETVFQTIIKKSYCADIVKGITKKQASLVVASGMYETLFYVGLFDFLRDAKDHFFDVILTAGIPYALLLASLHTTSTKEYKKLIMRFFSERSIEELFKVSYPEKYFFKNNGILSCAHAISNKSRIECYKVLPYVVLRNEMMSRIFSTGFAHELVASSLSYMPFFEGSMVNKHYWFSAFPLMSIIPEILLRTHIEYIAFIHLRSTRNPLSPKSKTPEIFRKFVDFISECYLYAINDNYICDAKEELVVPEISSIVDLVEKSLAERDVFHNIIHKLLRKR